MSRLWNPSGFGRKHPLGDLQLNLPGWEVSMEAPPRREWPPRRQLVVPRALPAQQRLMPMPTFGTQPVPVVAGQARGGAGGSVVTCDESWDAASGSQWQPVALHKGLRLMAASAALQGGSGTRSRR